MNGYIAFYNGQKKEVYAATSYDAQKAAAKLFKLKDKRVYQVTVMLAEKDGNQVTHSSASL